MASSSEESSTSNEIVELHGVKISIDPSVMSPVVIDCIRSGSYETIEARWLSQLIEPGERLVEIGGGIGLISALAGLQRKCESIFVFEANPELISLIELTHRLNDVTAWVRNAAVVPRAKEDVVPFHICHDLWSSSTLPVPAESLKRVALVRVAELDAILKELTPSMLIVDTEGSEVDLLANADLSGVKKVLVELHQEIIGALRMKAIFDRLSEERFAYNARYSEGQVVLFERISDG